MNHRKTLYQYFRERKIIFLLILFVGMVGFVVTQNLNFITEQQQLDNRLRQKMRVANYMLVRHEQNNLGFLWQVVSSIKHDTTPSPKALLDNPNGLKTILEPYFRDGVNHDRLILDRLIVFDRQGQALLDWERVDNPDGTPKDTPDDLGSTDLTQVNPIWQVVCGAFAEPNVDKLAWIGTLPHPDHTMQLDYFYTIAPVYEDGTVVGGVIIASHLDQLVVSLRNMLGETADESASDSEQISPSTLPKEPLLVLYSDQGQIVQSAGLPQHSAAELTLDQIEVQRPFDARITETISANYTRWTSEPVLPLLENSSLSAAPLQATLASVQARSTGTFPVTLEQRLDPCQDVVPIAQTANPTQPEPTDGQATAPHSVQERVLAGETVFAAARLDQQDYQFAYTPLEINEQTAGIFAVGLARGEQVTAWTDTSRWVTATLVVVILLTLVGPMTLVVALRSTGLNKHNPRTHIHYGHIIVMLVLFLIWAATAISFAWMRNGYVHEQLRDVLNADVVIFQQQEGKNLFFLQQAMAAATDTEATTVAVAMSERDRNGLLDALSPGIRDGMLRRNRYDIVLSHLIAFDEQGEVLLHWGRDQEADSHVPSHKYTATDLADFQVESPSDGYDSSESPPRYINTNLEQLALIERFRNEPEQLGGTYSTFATFQNESYLVTIVPVRLGEEIVGGLMIASRLDKLLALLNHQNYQAQHITLHAMDGTPLGSTMTAKDAQGLHIADSFLSQLSENQLAPFWQRTVDGQMYHVTAAPLTLPNGQADAASIGYLSVGIAPEATMPFWVDATLRNLFALLMVLTPLILGPLTLLIVLLLIGARERILPMLRTTPRRLTNLWRKKATDAAQPALILEIHRYRSVRRDWLLGLCVFALLSLGMGYLIRLQTQWFTLDMSHPLYPLIIALGIALLYMHLPFWPLEVAWSQANLWHPNHRKVNAKSFAAALRRAYFDLSTALPLPGAIQTLQHLVQLDRDLGVQEATRLTASPGHLLTAVAALRACAQNDPLRVHDRLTHPWLRRYVGYRLDAAPTQAWQAQERSAMLGMQLRSALRRPPSKQVDPKPSLHQTVQDLATAETLDPNLPHIAAYRDLYSAILRALEADHIETIANYDYITPPDLIKQFQLITPQLHEVLKQLNKIAATVRSHRAATSPITKRNTLLTAYELLDGLVQPASALWEPFGSLMRFVIEQWRGILVLEGGELARTESSGPVKNPYVLNNPVEGDLFVGREDIMHRLEELWTTTGQVPSVILFGHRRMGKSSILRNLGPRFGSDTIVVDFNMQRVGLIANTHELLYHLALALYDSLPPEGQAALAEPDEDYFKAHNPTIALDRYLKQIDRVRENWRCIITVDEFEMIERRIKEGRLDPNLLDFWRGLIQTYPWFIMVFAGLHTLEEMTHDYWNPLFGSVTPIPVSFLTEGAARRLITQPAPDFPIDYDEDAIAEIISLTNGQPFLVQLIGHTLVTRFNRRMYEEGDHHERRFTLADIAKVIDAAEFYRSGDAYFTGIWSQAKTSTPADQTTVLRVLSQGTAPTTAVQTGHSPNPQAGMALEELVARTGLSDTQVSLALETLIRHEVVAKHAGCYRYTVELMRRWVAHRKVQ